ncbi:MAG TPA: ATP-binding protein [Candidatus Binataceae bacterium]|nr:ATP-binding protein [Candidatus Binataceae bacterium]
MKLWRDIIDSLPDAIIVLSGTFEPLSVNPAAETMLGTSSITRPQLTDLLEHNPWLDRMVRNCLKTGQSVGDPDTVLGMGPRSITVRTEVSPLLNEDGRAQGAIIQLHDLAHQKSAAQVTDSSELSLRLSPAGLAHEIKNPLTGIKGAAELLSAMYPAEQRVQQYYAVIRDGVNRITGLVEEVLAVSAPQRLVKEPVNIHQVLHQALRMAGLYPKAPEAIRIEQDFDPSLPEVSGDAAALERAFLNLVKNAHEALGTSGTIRMHTRIETEFRMTNDGQRLQFLRVEISDNGVGIGEDALAQLFTPFFTTKPAGTGLGLVLSQRIIALHGGRLWATRGGLGRTGEESEPPAGMTFKVTLPIGAARLVDGAGRGGDDSPETDR